MTDTVRDKINNRMDVLQHMMETQVHLNHPSKVLDQMVSITKFWSVMSEEDKEYVDCARFAMKEKTEWIE